MSFSWGILIDKSVYLTWCIGFMWRGFGIRGYAGVVSVRSVRKLLYVK